jgi:hypothetical protein
MFVSGFVRHYQREYYYEMEVGSTTNSSESNLYIHGWQHGVATEKWHGGIRERMLHKNGHTKFSP